jgi:hypothetical protein
LIDSIGEIDEKRVLAQLSKPVRFNEASTRGRSGECLGQRREILAGIRTAGSYIDKSRYFRINPHLANDRPAPGMFGEASPPT